MRIAVDVCVSASVELELWRAGYKVPVRAKHGEDDARWLARAAQAGCAAVITMDRGAAQAARALGMFSILIPVPTPSHEMPIAILDAMEALEDRLMARAPRAEVG